MKKIVALILIICTLVFSTVSLSSCELFGIGDDIFGDGGEGGNTSGGGTGDGENTGNGGNTGSGNQGNESDVNCEEDKHIDSNDDGSCDLCLESVLVIIDFYVVNDLHGKFCDTDTQPGVDELGTYFELMGESDDNVVILSSGDMWQGTAESNLTGGLLVTEWMNELDFVSMTIGNHEYDWGEDAIRNNLAVAEFPFLAINIYDRETNTRVDYCDPSVMIERDGIQIGIIGAIGDCYSSISSDMVEGVYFKVGSELTSLVKAESERLRNAGADLIVYSLHDGYGSSSSGTGMIGSAGLSGYYDSVLSGGYVDLVFEAHTHQHYTFVDGSGVYHLQGGGENYGISHAEIAINSANGNNKVTDAGVVRNSTYGSLADNEATEELEDKYSEVIDYAYSELGVVSKTYSSEEVEDYVAALYLEAGLEKWQEQYDIVLGGGFLRTRSPYDLSAGVTTYADVLSLLPFDNRIVLCSVLGSNLKNKFIYTSNSDYHIALSDYGSSILNNISNSETYYIIVDTYTALYAPNRLTVVDTYDQTTFARDLLAEAIKNGAFEIKTDNYTLTPIADVLENGETLGSNKSSQELYYVKGTVKSNPNSTYGNLYIVDENGDEIYVYGLYDTAGKRYDAMSVKPQAGDTIIVYSNVYKYVYGSTETIELKNATLIEIV